MYIYQKLGMALDISSTVIIFVLFVLSEWSYDEVNFVFLGIYEFKGNGISVKLVNAGVEKFGYDVLNVATRPTSYRTYCAIGVLKSTDGWCSNSTLFAFLFSLMSLLIGFIESFGSVLASFAIKFPTWDGAGRNCELPFLICCAFFKTSSILLSIIFWVTSHNHIQSKCLSTTACISFGSSFYLACFSLGYGIFTTVFWRICFKWQQALKSGKITDSFILAAKIDNVDELLICIANGVEIDTNGSDGRNALHWACAMNRSGVCHVLLKKGATISKKDVDGWTALHWACRMGNPDIVRLLAKHGADINAKDMWGTTPLMLTVIGNSKSAAQYLLDLGANIDAKNVFHQTALMLCSDEGSELRSFIIMLLNNGASTSLCDAQGMSPLHYAASSGDSYAVETLLECSDPIILLKENKFGETPLYESMLRNRKRTMSLLQKYEFGESNVSEGDDTSQASTEFDSNSEFTSSDEESDASSI